jgi:hypothetical protein
MPVMKDFVDAASGNASLTVSAENFRNLVDNISSINAADKAYLIYMYGVKKNKSGKIIKNRYQKKKKL